jgi:hypothetical protein
MLEHCRQKHPEKFAAGEIHTTELVVTDTHGRALNWDEVRQIVDDPSFWQQPLK